ncbi:MAG: hypothetical protein GF344_08420 [Chitinivibrionales bacterium]|nr:hypothetical protein [Chitinivibrionales bacterium]MBD3356901.1 hypothetical protein [Chitinivibrionales bacterium]
MAQNDKLFHESWHRIANQRIALRSSARIHRLMFRGSPWYVVQDAYSSNFYRLRPAAYRFIARLRLDRTIEEVWNEAMARDPDETPGQGDVIELLAQLYHANLLHYTAPPDTAKLFERRQKQQQRMMASKVKNIMFFRIPLFDPDPLLKKMLPFIHLLISPGAALVWFGVVGMGIKIAIDNFAQLRVQSEGILAPSNLFFLYLGLLAVKALHEFGHACTVRRFGGEVHTVGVMFMVFSPLPYTDASAVWSFPIRWRRILVSGAGIIFELFAAAVALFVWAHTGPGMVHSLAYNIVFIASISTLLLNINPLMRFDGYYILCDLLDIPNLQQQSYQQLTWIMERFGFGCKNVETPAATPKDAAIYTGYGVLSSLYRLVIFSSILLFVADRFLIAGILMAVICIAAWVILPVFKAIGYLATSPKLERTRPRAIGVSAIVAGLVFVFTYFVPFPADFKSPGILKAVDYSIVVNPASGYVREILVESGTRVTKGTQLMRLENPGLPPKLKETKAAIEETQVRYQKAMRELPSDMAPLASRLSSLNKRLERLRKEEHELVIKASFPGVWVCPRAHDFEGVWVQRGTPLGQLINDEKFHFVSVVSQFDVSQLFAEGIRAAEVKLAGNAGATVAVVSYTSIPMEHTTLPSSALGWAGGGTVALDATDPRGLRTAEPFYEVRARVDTTAGVPFLHGRSGKIRFSLSSEPLLPRAWRALRQVIQKRYQL